MPWNLKKLVLKWIWLLISNLKRHCLLLFKAITDGGDVKTVWCALLGTTSQKMHEMFLRWVRTGWLVLPTWNNSAEILSGMSWEGRPSFLAPEQKPRNSLDCDYTHKQSSQILIPVMILPEATESVIVAMIPPKKFTTLLCIFFRGGYKMKKCWKKQPKKWPYYIKNTGNTKK